MDSRISSCLTYAVVASLSLAILVPQGTAQANVQGQWSTLPYVMPINPIHVALLNNGKVLVVAGSGNCPPSQSGCPSGPPYGPSNNSGALLWDPVAGAITQFSVSWDMFCNGMVVMQDGRALIDGGTIQYDPFYGQPEAAIFNPSTNTFTNAPNMANGRWYPTVTTLGDGRIMAFSGLNELGATNTSVEFYTDGSGWSQEYPAGWTPPNYPRMHLLPNGNVFYSGPGTSSALFDPSTTYLDPGCGQHQLRRHQDLWDIGAATFDAGQQLRSQDRDYGREQPGHQYHGNHRHGGRRRRNG